MRGARQPRVTLVHSAAMKTTLRDRPLLRSSRLGTFLAIPALALAFAAFQGCGSDSDEGGAAGSGGAGGAGGTGGSETGGTAGTAGTGGDAGSGNERHVVLLFTSDEHSHMLGFSPEVDDYPPATTAGTGTLRGGVARRAALLAQEKASAAAEGKDVLVLSSGDNQMGTMSTIAFETDSIDYGLMKALSYDATTIGNHEMDFGPAALAQSITAAGAGDGLPPIVASNIHFSDTDAADDSLAALYSDNVSDDKPIHPYRVITTAGGVKVGLIGYVGINASHDAPNKAPVTFSVPVDPENDGDPDVNLPALYADLQPVVDKLRNDEKVDIVVALAHAGVADPLTPEGIAAGEDTRVCENVAGIDVILSGHRHEVDPAPMKMTNTTTGNPCVVLNAGYEGRYLGRVELAVPDDTSKGISFDEATQTLIQVNDTIVADATFASSLDHYISKIEASGSAGTSSLAQLLSHAEGQSIVDDPATVGDLYFRPLASTDFDVTDTHAVLWLSADAMMAQADQLAASGVIPKTDLAAESAGVVRARILQGKTGVITAADAFNIVPLGSSPLDGTAGYPLIRANLTLLEVRAVIEFSLALSASDSNFDLGFAGLKVEFDKTRPPAANLAQLFDPTKGQVMTIAIDSDHSDGFTQYDEVVYDRANSIDDVGRMMSVVTTSYIGQFAGDAGAKLKNDSGTVVPVTDCILKRTYSGGDGTEVKHIEGFMGYIFSSPGGKLPSTYNADAPGFGDRWVCLGGC